MKVLAINTNGDITYCTCPPDERGKGRCNHVDHQRDGETNQEFIERININREKLESEAVDNEFIGKNGATITTKPLRFTEEQLNNMEKIENKFQLDIPLSSDAYIEAPEPLWNDMDKNYFSELSGISIKNICGIIDGEVYFVKSNTSNYRIRNSALLSKNKILNLAEKDDTADLDEAIETLKDNGLEVATGIEELNNLSKRYNFEATRYISVLPYYMRQGTTDEEGKLIDNNLTSAYKYLLRNRSNPSGQQKAYERLLNNGALGKDKAKFAKGFREKSLADEFCGKSGVFRKFLSGNSISHSGRAVITPSIDIKFGEIAVPSTIAVDLFKPTILKQLLEEGKTDDEIDEWFSRYRVKQTNISEEYRKELEDRIRSKRVLMNRQPSLHISSLQSFRPRISNNASCQIRPEYCKAFGADFDGDTTTLYGINQDSIIPTVDKELDSKRDINTTVPRAINKSNILPSKDSLWGLMNILDKRSDK